MKSFKMLGLLAALMLVAPYAHAQMTMKTPAEFVKAVAVANKFEIVSSKLALKKSKDAQVREFAEQMIKDHTKAGADFKKTLPKSSVKPAVAPKKLDEAHQVVYDKLVKTDGMDFDREYIKAQDDAHKEAVQLFANYSNNGSDAALKAFATRTLPTLKMHQEHVTSLKAGMFNDKAE